MGTDLLHIDKYEADIHALKSETVWLTNCLNERIGVVHDSFDSVKDEIAECKGRIDELFALLRPVLDA
jgi:hypothetical protein